MTNYSRAKLAIACTLVLRLFCPSPAHSSDLELAWNPSSDLRVVGYNLYYGLQSGVYTSSVNADASLTSTITGLTPGQTYYFAVAVYDADGVEGMFSNEVTNRIPFPPGITAQPIPQTAVAGAPVSLMVSASGDAPLSYQWLNGLGAISGATNSVLGWSQAGSSNAGNYTVIVSNPWGSVTSSVASVTVIVPPVITVQPTRTRLVIATSYMSFSAAASGTAPLSYQWYWGSNALAGATNSAIAWLSAALTNTGNYSLVAANSAGTATSAVANLTVLPTNTIGTFAGVYNGLFYACNSAGSPATTEATAGSLGNLILTSNAAYSARLYIGGQSFPMAGSFDITGNASTTISRAGTGLSNVAVVLSMGLFNGTSQYGKLIGTVSSATSGSNWTSALTAYPATNAPEQTGVVNLLVAPSAASNSPAAYGVVTGLASNGVLSLSGLLGDAAVFLQTVPISQNGSVPLYGNLYNNNGLLEGWLSLAGGAVSGTVTWIRPGGVLAPPGFPQGFSVAAAVTGTVVIH